jgi:hypothetical protein
VNETIRITASGALGRAGANQKPYRSALTLLVCLIIACLPAAAQNDVQHAAGACDASCLSAAMDDYLARVVSHRTSEIRIAPDALIFFNTHAAKLDENPLGRVKTVKSKQVFCDAVSGNVVARTGVELEDGKIAYASSRLKIVGGRITQVESSFDDSPRVVSSYVAALNPLMTTIVPVEKRMPRPALQAIVARYFDSLTTHTASASDFDDGCDRYHSGQRITHNAQNTVEGGTAVTCYTAILGNPPWGPATDIHIPLVDPEHGIVAGYTVLLYKDGTAPMYVSEIFKILDGKVVMIDNIGLKAEGIKAMKLPD